MRYQKFLRCTKIHRKFCILALTAAARPARLQPRTYPRRQVRLSPMSFPRCCSGCSRRARQALASCSAWSPPSFATLLGTRRGWERSRWRWPGGGRRLSWWSKRRKALLLLGKISKFEHLWSKRATRTWNSELVRIKGRAETTCVSSVSNYYFRW